VFYVRQPGTILQVRARVLFARHIRFAALLTVFSQSGATATVTTVSPVYSGTMSATNTASSILDLSLNGVQFIFRDILAGVGSSANYQFMFYDQPVVHSVNPKSSPQAGKGIASVLAFNVWRDSTKLKCKFAGPDGNVRMSWLVVIVAVAVVVVVVVVVASYLAVAHLSAYAMFAGQFGVACGPSF
jgi:hypothetical protein